MHSGVVHGKRLKHQAPWFPNHLKDHWNWLQYHNGNAGVCEIVVVAGAYGCFINKIWASGGHIFDNEDFLGN